MKKSLLIILLGLLVMALPACRSKKDSVGQKIEETTAGWRNVGVPVRLEVLEPQKFTLSGRLTMVRDQYALISLRMLGFEVAQLYVTPEEVDVVVKQMNKMWIQEPLAERFAELNFPFSTLQDALLGQQGAIDRLPKSLNLTVSGSEDAPVLTLKVSPMGKNITGRMTLSLDQAVWDSPRPATFTEPSGAEYKKVRFKDLPSLLK